MSAAGPAPGRLREQGEAKARRARLRARAAADLEVQRGECNGAEAANCPSGHTAATAASVGALR